MSKRIATARLKTFLNVGLMFAAVALLCLTFPRTSAVVSIPQGKGGEVIAKPTPTPAPKKTTRKRAGARPSGSSAVDELAFWETIKNSTDPEDFKAYLEQYPKGKFVTLAKNRLKTLEGTKSSTNATSTNRNSTNPSPMGPSVTNPSSSNKPKPAAVVQNKFGIEFVWIPPGSFMMGGNGIADAPVHRVKINRGFYMGRYEVTQGQWQAAMGTHGSMFKGEDLPVDSVSWNRAQEFIERLNQMNDGYIYRLPSEAEWEYACRAGTTTRYAFGDSLSSDQANFNGNYPDGGATKGVYRKKTTPVGSFQPNAFGLYDMHGNVDEWCQDVYHYPYDGAPTDGSAWVTGGDQRKRVMRGGNWDAGALRAASANSWAMEPDFEGDVGVRVVAVPREAIAESLPTNPGSTNPSSAKTATPPNPPLPLHSFDFVTVTLDKDRKLKSRETKNALAYTEDLGNGVKLEMVAIPPGEFMMGSPEGQGAPNEHPQHRVRIAYWYYLGEFEVTQAQWRAVIGNNPSRFKDCDDCPVEQVSWDDAVDFCRKLTTHARLSASGTPRTSASASGFGL